MIEKNILLLGGGGFIGSALCGRLCENGFNVHVLTRQGLSKRLHPQITFRSGSMDDKRILESVLPKCKTVIHLASSTTPSRSSRSPSLEAEMNLAPTLRFLEILQYYQNVHLIFISSGGTLYGNPKFVPVNENNASVPLSFYGAGKAATETFLRTFSVVFEGDVTIVRPSNVYGPRQPFRRGFGVIRTMLEHVRHGTEMEIWGDGTSVRDYLYIEDMIDALIRLVYFPKDNETYNVGSGIGYSLNQLKEIIESVCGKELRTQYRPSRKTDVKKIVLDSSRLIQKTKWHPTVTIEKGIELTWKWLN